MEKSPQPFDSFSSVCVHICSFLFQQLAETPTQPPHLHELVDALSLGDIFVLQLGLSIRCQQWRWTAARNTVVLSHCLDYSGAFSNTLPLSSCNMSYDITERLQCHVFTLRKTTLGSKVRVRPCMTKFFDFYKKQWEKCDQVKIKFSKQKKKIPKNNLKKKKILFIISEHKM